MRLHFFAGALATLGLLLSHTVFAQSPAQGDVVQIRAQLIEVAMLARATVGSRTETGALDACTVRIALGLPPEATLSDALTAPLVAVLTNTDHSSCAGGSRDYGLVEIDRITIKSGTATTPQSAIVRLRVWRGPQGYEEESYEFLRNLDASWSVAASTTSCCRPDGADVFVPTPKPGLVTHYYRRELASLLVVDDMVVPPWERDSVLRSLAGSTLVSIRFELSSRELLGRFGSRAAFGVIFVTRKR